MKGLNKFEAFKLSKTQMNEVNGGINAEEYCNELHDNFMANGATWDSETKTAFASGWAKAECHNYHKDICF